MTMKATHRGRFKPGQSGNPNGKAPGTRNRATRALEELLAGDAENIVRKASEMALSGDPTGLRLCLERLIPVRKDRPIKFALPAIEKTEDLTKATGALLAAVAAGDLTPSEAAELGKLVDAHVRAVEAVDLHQRLARLEEGRP
ncbi:DUF5681 domain-containing protein [Enterovirga sp. CN4-39]|uniref:DUF5681 domain-containing protein n=1 Tax=Enterovirga sp. CN4-39 TaxID=3400910 RepID=UPI003C101738